MHVIDPVRSVNRNLPQRRLDGAELVRDLEERLRRSQDPLERAHLADRLVPELVTDYQGERAAEVLAGIADPVGDVDLQACILALRGVVKALNGGSPADDIEAALRLLPRLSGPKSAIVRHRAGVASLHAHNAHDAEEHQLAALALCDQYGMRWLGARASGALYALCYHVTGDLQGARYYAKLTTSLANAAGDAKVRRMFLGAQYDLACVFADWDEAKSLRELLRRDRSPEDYVVGYPLRISDALLLGQAGDFAAMRGRLEAALSAGNSPVDNSFILALQALATAGLGNKAEARTLARRSLGLSGIRQAEEQVHLATRRRLAGVIAAWVSVIVGDTYHGMRALGVRARWTGSSGALAAALEREARGLTYDGENPSIAPVRGYLAVAQRARLGMLSLEAVVPFKLTTTELDVLRAVAQGKSNAAIALERGVSRNAVERRLMSAYDKLEVRTRVEAIAKISKLL